jgi:thymidine kinase
MLSIVHRNIGWIEVICGSMFSGKSEELIRRLRRAIIARQKVAIFKPQIDNRFSKDHIVSHSELKIASSVVRDAWEILEQSLESQVVGIDEAQFYDADLVVVCQKLANMGKRVIVAGLDQDYRGEPFDPIPQLLAVAEYITKTHAICVICGNPANYTQRKTEDKERVVVGKSDIYEARCRNCFEPPENHKKEIKFSTKHSKSGKGKRNDR